MNIEWLKTKLGAVFYPRTHERAVIDSNNNTLEDKLSSINTALAGKYVKPQGGIPASDMTSSVQTSLGKADTALQQHQDISGKEDKSNKKTTITGNETSSTYYPTTKAVADYVKAKTKAAIVAVSETTQGQGDYLIAPDNISIINDTLGTATITIDENNGYMTTGGAEKEWLYTVVFKTGSSPAITLAGNDGDLPIIQDPDMSFEANKLYELSIMYVGNYYFAKANEYDVPVQQGGGESE